MIGEEIGVFEKRAVAVDAVDAVIRIVMMVRSKDDGDDHSSSSERAGQAETGLWALGSANCDDRQAHTNWTWWVVVSSEISSHQPISLA